MATAELVFIPTSGVGHLVSTIKFVTQFLNRDHRFSATILVLKYPSFTPTPTDGTSNPPPPTSVVTPATPRIRIIHLPVPPNPPSPQILSKSFEHYCSLYIASYKTLVKNAIIDLAVPVVGLIIDLFCTSMIDVGNELGINSYIFFTSCGGFLGSMLQLETRDRCVGVEFDRSEADVIISSFAHPVPMRVLPHYSFNGDGFRSMAIHARKFKESKGIIINTFADLEPYALISFSEDGGIPPIYTVGPVLDLESETRPIPQENQSREIRVWLDNQPPLSVVFLCFGSRGCFSQTQVVEIANGLERSGVRFLWSLRRPPPPHKRFEAPTDYADPDDVLPEGFQERVKGKGRVCGWVRQVDVLAHKAIGGFVSHCGWNSVLESIWHAVPLAAWPQYAEQQLNAFMLVRELGLAVEMKMDYHRVGGSLVTADQIERVIRCLMNGNDAGEMRKRMKEISKKSREALIPGGSSNISFGNLIDDMLASSF
ncbi:anthocyanidin 3-O-glucosyltransferase 2-like [Benincasa hispida]|uniref:anthocyanidin 3-O-glucosyltransferase 2-like n=1 Tax=Benincasa hispida TaxID=102211 RepID=UPI0018FF501A|nr:anthocyanidin 3-O-glucosyltransferase 2-like [Benincasa hispida]